MRHLGVSRLRLAQNDDTAIVEKMAFIRRMKSPRGASQQRDAQFLLQPSDLMADDGLCHTEPLGRQRKGTGIDDRCEEDQPVQIEKVAHGALSNQIIQSV